MKIVDVKDQILWLMTPELDTYMQLIKVGDKVNDPHLIQKFGRKTYNNSMLRYLRGLLNEKVDN